MNLLLFIVVLGFIVFVHEFGHFIFAKIFGVYVYDFSLGMGPKLLQKKGKETTYTLRLVPIGGFCQLAGENLDDDDAKKVPKNRRLQSKKPYQRFLIMFFGAGNNFISAFLILFIVALFWGGTTMKPVIDAVEEGYPAYEAGMSAGDRVISIDGHKVTTSDDISLYLTISDPDKKTAIKVEKEDGTIEVYRFKPKKIVEKVKSKSFGKVKTKKQESYRYGIGMKQEETRGFVNALKYMVKKSASLFKQMWVTVICLFSGKIRLSQLSGPVGIYTIVGEQSKAGIDSVLFLIAYLSINVGFINLLPLPAFDGGHILFIIIEKIKGKPVSPELENKIHAIGLILLLLLMAIVTINDIIKLF